MADRLMSKGIFEAINAPRIAAEKYGHVVAWNGDASNPQASAAAYVRFGAFDAIRQAREIRRRIRQNVSRRLP